jgi:ABC-2 type transport system ATP-binding protein
VTLATADDAKARTEIARGLGIEGELAEDGLRLRVEDGEACVPRLFDHLSVGVHSINVRRPSLDDVFIKYTGRDMRDAEASVSQQMSGNAMVRAFRKS